MWTTLEHLVIYDMSNKCIFSWVLLGCFAPLRNFVVSVSLISPLLLFPFLFTERRDKEHTSFRIETRNGTLFDEMNSRLVGLAPKVKS